MKTNPCELCLVKPCCTELCDKKSEYTEEAISFLCRLAKNIYKKNGKKRINISKLLTSSYNEAVEVCDANNKETNMIFNRSVDGHIKY